MPTAPFNFDASYLSLPESFYYLVEPSVLDHPKIVLINTPLCRDLGIREDELESYLTNFPKGANKSFAQAYAGHQFGHFTMLGDGRAIVLGEHLTSHHQRFDIQLKGSGRTPYSRGGDGKATLRAMLREYLMSEALYHLNIPTSRSLAVVKTGHPVHRESLQEGAALIRVMKSHIRVGTFEFAARFGEPEELKAFVHYTIDRLYPKLHAEENPVWSLLNKVIEEQLNLVAHWMRVGFIHGVMNTDNTSISGETFDYGPCAFLNTYHPGTVFSSIDHQGRYAFANQPLIIKWNLARFAETLLPLLHKDPKIALAMAQDAIDAIDDRWSQVYYSILFQKIGMEQPSETAHQLVDELLQIMTEEQLDYTNTFLSLTEDADEFSDLYQNNALKVWKLKWIGTIEKTGSLENVKEIMRKNNPVFIPRNHLVEAALDAAVQGELKPFRDLLGVLSDPYHFTETTSEFRLPPAESFERNYQTFCGT